MMIIESEGNEYGWNGKYWHLLTFSGNEVRLFLIFQVYFIKETGIKGSSSKYIVFVQPNVKKITVDDSGGDCGDELKLMKRVI